jgi:hypothetical protein
MIAGNEPVGRRTYGLTGNGRNIGGCEEAKENIAY